MRLPQLIVGLSIVGAGVASMARSRLGLGSWSVLHEGISLQAGVALGTADLLISLPVLLVWLPLRQLPGVGTLAAATLVGPATNVTLGLMAPPNGMTARLGYLAVGSALIALGSAMYLAVDLGPGPRDGLMTGIHRRRGWSIRRVRTVIELSVLLIGFLMGGTIGIGTVVHAVAVGPLIQVNLRWLDREGSVMNRGQSTQR